MKKIIICAMILILSAHSFGQQTTATTPVLTKTDYLLKSKHQKAAAWILLGTGVTLIGIGGTIGAAQSAFIIADNIGSGLFGGTSNTSNTDNVAGGGVITIGLLFTASSIPFFIAAAKNKRKASEATVSFKMEKAPIIQHSSFVQTSFPAVSVKINL